ncbi:hypothetical protein Patl1_10751 [Pistacia atlantica]|uniref:Uncharacterized protein n=1 Tax=Pistacia atlantica TaxID=434234 RepID=A0ACC1A655_9ROSI|nr:hypothetical protein Patl1_10751 [Pistacia atlantica]
MENEGEKELTEKPEEEDDDDGPPPGWQQPIPPPASTAPPPPPSGQEPFYSLQLFHVTLDILIEMAQMVCGSCRRLLTHPQGAKHVKCSCCQTINFVLEEYNLTTEWTFIFLSDIDAHQVGQVKCASCAALLMYPYGAPLVRCSSCHVVTEIGDHNRRPPWSVQQAQPTPPSKVR